MLHIVSRTFLLYIIVLVVIRLMGKREIGQLSTFDFVVSVIVAELAAIPMEEMKKPIMEGITPILTVVAAEIILSYLALKSIWLRGLIDGQPSVIVANGELQIAEMRRCRYNLEDLLTQLREKSIADPGQVNYAILETSGKLSIFLKEDYPVLPKPVIMDGDIIEKNLQQLGQTNQWLIDNLNEYHNIEPKDVFFASINKEGKLQVWPREKNKNSVN